MSANLGFECFVTHHDNCQRVVRALAKGLRAPIYTLDPAEKTSIAAHVESKPQTVAVVYGILRGASDVIAACSRVGRPYLYIDHGYLCADKGYYRLVPNGFIHANLGTLDTARLDALKIEFAPWRVSKPDDPVLVVPPTKPWEQFLNLWYWELETVRWLRDHCKRPVITSRKRDSRSTEFGAALPRAAALVTYISNTANDALLAGVPAFNAGDDWSGGAVDFDNPPQTDRKARMAFLANHQWTVAEMEHGVPVQTLLADFDSPVEEAA